MSLSRKSESSIATFFEDRGYRGSDGEHDISLQMTELSLSLFKFHSNILKI
jgi:hypothetical protein